MSINNVACTYLFGADAKTIFKNFECQNKEEFVNESLEILMKINRHLLANKDAFAFVDPMAFNDQCHLYALKAFQIRKKYNEISEEERSQQSPENRYLHLAIFLNYAVSTEANTFVKVVEKAIKELSIDIKDKKTFNRFLKDQEDFRKARIALNEHFRDDLRARFNDSEINHVYEELSALTQEDLCISKYKGLYTFPKLAGVAYLLDRIAKENIPFVIKIKILTPDGAAGVIVKSSRQINPDESVIVIEGFATDGTMTLPYCEQEAKKCDKYFHRYVQTKKRHEPTDNCFYCRAVQIDLTPYRKRLNEVMNNPDDMLLALGADFIDKMQPEFKQYFTNSQKFPFLTYLYTRGHNLIQKYGLGMESPTTFSVCHVYCDSGEKAVSSDLQLDMIREEFLKSRGIL